MNSNFLIRQSQLHQAFEQDSSGGGGELSRRIFIKRAGAATVACAISLQLAQIARAEETEDGPFSRYFSCINDAVDLAGQGVSRTTASDYVFTRGSSHADSIQYTPIGSTGTFRLKFTLFGAAGGPSQTTSDSPSCSRYVKVYPKNSYMKLELQGYSYGDWEPLTPSSHSNLEWIQSSFDRDETATILCMQEDDGEHYFSKTGSPVTKVFSGTWSWAGMVVTISGKYLVRNLVRDVSGPSSGTNQNFQLLTFMGITDFNGTVGGVPTGSSVSLGLDSVGLGSSWGSENIPAPVIKNLLFSTAVLKQCDQDPHKQWVADALMFGDLVEYAAPENA